MHVCTILLTIQYNNINSIYAHASQYCRGTYQVTACGYAGNLDLSVLWASFILCIHCMKLAQLHKLDHY